MDVKVDALQVVALQPQSLMPPTDRVLPMDQLLLLWRRRV